MANIFDLRLTTRQHLQNLEDTLTTHRASLNIMTERSGKATADMREAYAKLDEAQKRINKLEAALKDANQQVVTAQNGRLAHNDKLYAAGKAFAALKRAWQFRQGNPKMNPKQRQENNSELAEALSALETSLPKKISDPIELAQ